MHIPTTTNKKIQEPNLEVFKARLTGKLCIAIVNFIQIISAVLIVFGKPIIADYADWLILFAIPLRLAMIAIILIEYFLFKKNGMRFAKYADHVDITLLLISTADWALTAVTAFGKVLDTSPPSFEITALYLFTTCSWRTIMVTLLVQNWKLKAIPSSVAVIMMTGYVIYYLPGSTILIIVRSAIQLFCMLIIIFCEDKIKWKLIWSSLHKEKWMQVNNFILNNLPENIMILDFRGDARFISDYCKSFMEASGIPHEKTQDLFEKIQDLQQLQSENKPSSDTRIQIEKLTTQNELFTEPQRSSLKVMVLKDLVTNFKGVIEEENLQERQFLIYNGKLAEKSIEIKISFIRHFNNEYIILILRDMTQRDLLVTLEETNKYKDELLASVSHELRAPLNGNINLIEGALNSPKTPEEIKNSLLVPALRSGKFLLHIINDILDMSQIKERKLRLVFEAKSLEETLKSAAQLVELQARKKGIELILKLDPSLPLDFCTDHTRLSQIVLNLLSNAIKFTKQGVVKLKAEPVDSCSDWINIIVEDSGIGIHQENFQRLFSSYTNIEFDGRQAMNPAGVGLGLNIASNLVKLLAPVDHPEIRVSSVLSEGSIFSFIIENKDSAPVKFDETLDNSSTSFTTYKIADELPRLKSLPKIQKQITGIDSLTSIIMPFSTKNIELEALVDPECVCPKILIVDDNPFNTMAFETILSSLDIKCDSVYSGPAALKKLMSRQEKTCGKNCRTYSVVFMDQEMPEMTGSETVIEIKQLQSENSIPEMKIIGCTAHKAKKEVKNFMESGLDSCIFKPISVTMIRDILKELLVFE